LDFGEGDVLKLLLVYYLQKLVSCPIPGVRLDFGILFHKIFVSCFVLKKGDGLNLLTYILVQEIAIRKGETYVAPEQVIHLATLIIDLFLYPIAAHFYFGLFASYF